MTGIELIAKERLEQRVKHHRTLKYDAENNKDYELSRGAAALIEGDITWMPESWDEAVSQRMIGKSYQERLVIAGALIAAEIDRLNYKE
jgi:outer membrane cobalamin receptor